MRELGRRIELRVLCWLRQEARLDARRRQTVLIQPARSREWAARDAVELPVELPPVELVVSPEW